MANPAIKQRPPLTIRRSFKAALEEVWRTWIEPEVLKRWMAPAEDFAVLIVVRWQCWELAHYNKAFGALAFETVANPNFLKMAADQRLVSGAQRALFRLLPRARWSSMMRYLATPIEDRRLDMWQLSVPWWELIVRAVIVYVLLLVLLRVTGKRQVGQLAPFDLVLLLVLANAVQNAMNAGDNSLLAGIILAVALIGLNYVVAYATSESKAVEALIEGRPEILIHNGRLYENVMRRARLTHHELNAALREAGCDDVAQVHFAILENNGQISVTPKKTGASESG